uniref:ATP synthase F0 subunit 8 n=1 Tax=Arisubathynella cheongmiensis TaxID=2025387 RepID=A0A7R6D7J9_9CRUS|nr:ATP synthase F0 subunit 8 [Arisubathynella cheongmiensis]
MPQLSSYNWMMILTILIFIYIYTMMYLYFFGGYKMLKNYYLKNNMHIWKW